MGEASIEHSLLVGTWRLLSASSATPAGEHNETPYGVDPTGLLTYTADGRVAAIISYGGRKQLSPIASAEDQAEAYRTFVSYAGRYRLNGGQITHFVEVSSIQSYVGRKLVRTVRYDDSRIVLVAPPTMVNGEIQSLELLWERLVPTLP